MNSFHAWIASPTARRPATVLLVRHAATDVMHTSLSGRVPTAALNAEGERQAAQLAHCLSTAQLTAIYSSPLLRARATAEVIAASLELAVRLEPDLTEIDFGEWTGLTFRELAEREDWHRYNAARAGATVPHGEAPAAARIGRTMTRVAGRHAGETVALVTHAELIRYAIVRARRRSLDDRAGVDVPPASVMRLQCEALDD
jgi:probable phosphoglycerate mutase